MLLNGTSVGKPEHLPFVNTEALVSVNNIICIITETVSIFHIIRKISQHTIYTLAMFSGFLKSSFGSHSHFLINFTES